MYIKRDNESVPTKGRRLDQTAPVRITIKLPKAHHFNEINKAVVLIQRASHTQLSVKIVWPLQIYIKSSHGSTENRLASCWFTDDLYTEDLSGFLTRTRNHENFVL